MEVEFYRKLGVHTYTYRKLTGGMRRASSESNRTYLEEMGLGEGLGGSLGRLTFLGV